MKTIELNISERIFALTILNGFKGSLENLATILDDIKQFPVTDEEWEKAERIIESNQWRWNDEKGGVKSISIEKETAGYLIDSIEEKDKKGEFGLQDRAVISLREKLTGK